jgi:mannose-6-phosphate isomerase-like protein (cupin superfamily)
MIRSGDMLENPVTGERIVFHRTSADTGGEYVEIECIVQPGGFVAAAHVHPHQSEQFQIVSGTVGFRAGRERIELGAGEGILVEPGTPHKFWNAGEDEARFVCQIRPALSFESLIETMFALAADGKTNRKGLPNPVRMARIARAHRDVIRLPFPPAWMQDAGTAMALPLAAMLGYGATYEPRPTAPAVATPAVA